MDNLTIKSWAEEDRPREKLLIKTKSALSDAELLAILIGSGSANGSAVDLAKILLQKAGNDLNELSKKSVQEILDFKIKGIGNVRAITIVAALELARRKQGTAYREKIRISSSRDIANIFIPMLADHPNEEFWVVFLNRAHRILGSERISIGGLSGTVADIRMIFKLAVTNLAAAIIVSHNHPSGNLSPSSADISLTQKLKKAGELLDISVLDHVIVSESGYYSFADEGTL